MSQEYLTHHILEFTSHPSSLNWCFLSIFVWRGSNNESTVVSESFIIPYLLEGVTDWLASCPHPSLSSCGSSGHFSGIPPPQRECFGPILINVMYEELSKDLKCTHLFVWYMSQYLTSEPPWSGPSLRGQAGCPLSFVSLCPAQRGGNPPDPVCPRPGWPLARAPWARGCHCPASASASPWSPGRACCRPRNSRTRLSLCPARGRCHEAGGSCCCDCCCWNFCCCCSVDNPGERRQCFLKQMRFRDMCLDLMMSLISHHHHQTSDKFPSGICQMSLFRVRLFSPTTLHSSQHKIF